MNRQDYCYDFSYSLAMSKKNICMLPENDNFVRFTKMFILSHCFINQQHTAISSALLKLEIFRNIGLKLYQIAKITLDDNSLKNLEEIREDLYQDRQKLLKILGNQTDKYLSIVVLLYHAVITKVLQSSIKNVQAEKIFHIISFELQGLLSSSQSYNKVIMENFHPFNFMQYLTTNPLQSEEKNDKIYTKAKQIKSFKDARQSLVTKNKPKFPFKTQCKSPSNMGRPVIKQPLSKTVKSPKRIPGLIFQQNKENDMMNANIKNIQSQTGNKEIILANMFGKNKSQLFSFRDNSQKQIPYFKKIQKLLSKNYSEHNLNKNKMFQ